jgi:hypothetical protein
MRIFFRRIQIIFDIENWLWKSDLGPFWQPIWTSVKAKSKNILLLLVFLLKSISCWLRSAKLHHWGHTNVHAITLSFWKFILGLFFSFFHVGIESVAKNVRSICGLIWKKGRSCFFLAKRICLFNGFVSQVATTLYYSPLPNETSKSPPPLLMRASGIMNDFWKPKLHHDSWIFLASILIHDLDIVCRSLHNTSNIAIISNSFWFIIFISNYCSTFLNSYKWWIKQLFDEKGNTMEPKRFYT